MILGGPGAFDMLIGRRRGDGDVRRVAVRVGREDATVGASMSSARDVVATVLTHLERTVFRPGVIDGRGNRTAAI